MTKTRVGVVSYDLKFFAAVLDELRSQDDLVVRVDEWETLHADNGAATEEILDWADVIVAEWCGPYAALASRRKREDQRLIVRLHRFEIDQGLCEAVEIDRVDRVVAVNDHYRRRLVEEVGWPRAKVVTIPNIVDTARFDRPKSPAARRNLGVLGATSKRKRLDRAVDLVEAVRRRDERFRLLVKSAAPADLKWVRDSAVEMAYAEETWPRLDALIGAGAAQLDPEGPDVPEWLAEVGFVLSVSDDESFHLAPAEGMASGAVPVILGWPGADTVYDERWIHDSIEDAADEVVALSESDAAWSEATRRARTEVERFAPDRVLPEWRSLIRSPDTLPVASTQ